MTSWRDTILDEFVPNVSKLTLVADADGLLTEERLALQLRQRGFDLIEFNDPIEFRYAYESQYRAIWDRGEQTDLVVILRLPDAELHKLPYDLLKAGRCLSFNLGDLFPNLSYPVIETLDRHLLDALFTAQQAFKPDRMGDNATKDFILRHVFGIAAELIVTDVELLKLLLRIHYTNIKIPASLTDRLIQVLRTRPLFDTWPLDDILPDDEAFFSFLQERWPTFIQAMGSSDLARESSTEYSYNYPGPDRLPFDHHDIRVYIDNLFTEGKLAAVENTGLSLDAGSWIRAGIVSTEETDDQIRISRLFDILENPKPTEDSVYTDWISYAMKWAELSALIFNTSDQTHISQLQQMGDTLNTTFKNWLVGHYASLISLPPAHPAMLHHIPRRLARDIEKPNKSRVALIVIDGLALDQWVTIRHILEQQSATLVIRESAVFAWIPTLTSVSRQSIFAGKQPLYFPASINSTNGEANLWKQFWEDHGLKKLDIAYQRSLGDGNAAEVMEPLIHLGKTNAVGLVIDKLDKIMHGMQLGSAGMHNQIKQWCQGGYLSSLISYLLDDKYEVWLTSDHGNIECHGIGSPSEGVIAETRGERVRIYPTPELRSQVAAHYPSAYEWLPIGLPQGYFPLVVAGRDAFVNPNATTVAHGSMTIEEVIVPLIKFERRLR